MPPKRHTGCHSDCADYILEKAFYMAAKEAADEKRYLRNAICEQRAKQVRKALKNKRN